MAEGYGKVRNITFQVSKVMQTKIECVSFLNEQFVTRQVDNFVASQNNVSEILFRIQDYFGSDYLSHQLLDNNIRVIVSPPEDKNPTIYEFFVDQVTVEKASLTKEMYRALR